MRNVQRRRNTPVRALPSNMPTLSQPVKNLKVECPECGGLMKLVYSKKVFPNQVETKPRPYWSCMRFPSCTGRHGAHADGRPLGIPGDLPTRRARRAVHFVAPLAFGDSYAGRNRFYGWLKTQPDLKPHIGQMNKKEALLTVNRLVEKRLVTSEQAAEAIMDSNLLT